jgi:hypothetical protein
MHKKAEANPGGIPIPRHPAAARFLKRVLPAKIRTIPDAGGPFAHGQPPASSHQTKYFLLCSISFVPNYLGAGKGLRSVNALSHDHSTGVPKLMG